jgi:hypothetical protein
LPIRHLIAVDRLAARSDGVDRDGDRRSRRGTNVTRRMQRDDPDERHPNRRS